MRNPHFTMNSPERPAVDGAEVAVGHPHTLGVEYTDDEVLIDGEDAVAYAEYGEDPDVETHLDEGHHDL